MSILEAMFLIKLLSSSQVLDIYVPKRHTRQHLCCNFQFYVGDGHNIIISSSIIITIIISITITITISITVAVAVTVIIVIISISILNLHPCLSL